MMHDLVDAQYEPVVRSEGARVFADSRDVAAYFEKRHDNVLQSIRALVDSEPSLAPLSFQASEYHDVTGRSLRCYTMSRDGFVLLVMGFTGGQALKLKMRYIEAFNRMEMRLRAPAAPVDLTDAATVRGLLLNFSERVLALEEKNKELQVDAAALDLIANADGSLCMTDAAKALQQRPKDFVAYLAAHNWIYRRIGGDHWVGYQARIQSGDLEHKVTTVMRGDGTEKITEQVRVTPQGLAKLAKRLGSPAAVPQISEIS